MVVSIILLLLLLISTGSEAEATCSDQQSTGGSTEGMANVQQVTKLQYCLVDDCTIMKIDTGEKLDIVYTTDSLLIITSAGNHTSMMISKNDSPPPCLPMDTNHNDDLAPFLGQMGLLMLLMIISGSVLITHLLSKELQNLFGKLLILYNLALCLMLVGLVTLSITHFQIKPNSQKFCRLVFFFFMQGDMSSEGLATCILAYLAYITYLGYNLRRLDSDDSKWFYRHCRLYTIGILALFDFFILSYDLATGNGKHTILPNGHCTFIGLDYDTMKIDQVNVTFNKMAQIVLFAIYLFYFYKLNKDRTDVSVPHKKLSRSLLKIAIAMGATVGISQFVWLLDFFVKDTNYIIGIVGGFALLV